MQIEDKRETSGIAFDKLPEKSYFYRISTHPKMLDKENLYLKMKEFEVNNLDTLYKVNAFNLFQETFTYIDPYSHVIPVNGTLKIVIENKESE